MYTVKLDSRSNTKMLGGTFTSPGAERNLNSPDGGLEEELAFVAANRVGFRVWCQMNYDVSLALE